MPDFSQYMPHAALLLALLALFLILGPIFTRLSILEHLMSQLIAKGVVRLNDGDDDEGPRAA